MRRTWEFTMIELLIVISIIVILAALLLPALRKAKEYSHEISCKSNLRQLHLVWLNYADDNNQATPLYYDSGLDAIWATVLFSNGYVKQPGYGKTIEKCKKGGLFICPSYAYDPYAGSAHTAYKFFVCNYALHTIMGGTNWKLIKYPSQTMLFCDTGDRNGASYRISSSALLTDNSPPILSTRHSGGLNIVFGDGHSKNHKGVMPIPLPTASNEWPWFKDQL